MTLLLFLTAAFAVQPADQVLPEAQMIPVFGAGETTQWAVFRPSIQRSGDGARATIQISHFRRARLSSRDEVEVEVNCGRKLYRPVSIARHDADSLIERRSVTEAEFPMTIAQPRTGPGAIVDRICAARFDPENSVSSSLRATRY